MHMMTQLEQEARRLSHTGAPLLPACRLRAGSFHPQFAHPLMHQPEPAPSPSPSCLTPAHCLLPVLTAGYALAVFIPMSIVCVVPIEVVRWSVVGAATLTSGTFIMLSLRGPIHESAGAKVRARTSRCVCCDVLCGV